MHYHFLNYRERDLELYKEEGELLNHFGITSILVTNGIIEDIQEFQKLIKTNRVTSPRIFYTSRISTIPDTHPAKGEAAKHFEDGSKSTFITTSE